MPFVDALNAANISPDLRSAIDAFVERKKPAEELDEGAAVPVINRLSTLNSRACPPSLTQCPNHAAASATSTPFSTTSGRKCNMKRPDPLGAIHETVQSIWSKGSGALASANRVAFMGYSLPPSDRTMIHFLRTSIEPKAKLEVVDLGTNTLSHYETLLPFATGRIEQKFSGQNCISDFVTDLEATR